MDIDPSLPQGSRNGSGPAIQQRLETSVQAKVFGKENLLPKDGVLVLRSAEENIGKNLIQQFDDESDEDEDVSKGKEVVLVNNNPEPSMPHIAWKGKKQWGPVQATRMSSRIPRDGKSVIEKAQDLKKAKNLEIPKGNKICGFSNSFAAIDNLSLVEKAKNFGISLGSISKNADDVVDKIKDVEIKRLEEFHLSNPACFLPNDISLTVEELQEGMEENVGVSSDQKDHISDVPDDDEPWTLVH
jgi:hypothetical protein